MASILRLGFSGFLSSPARSMVLYKPTNIVPPHWISLFQLLIILGLPWHLKVGEGTSREPRCLYLLKERKIYPP